MQEGDQKALEYKNASKYSPAGSRPNAVWHAQETAEKRQRFYCGKRPEIIQATVLQMCEGKASSLYRNPYGYDRLGTPMECHRSGFRRSYAQNAKSQSPPAKPAKPPVVI